MLEKYKIEIYWISKMRIINISFKSKYLIFKITKYKIE